MGHRSMLVLVLGILFAACSGGDEKSVERLTEYRILGITSDSDVLVWPILAGETTALDLAVVDYDPSDLSASPAGRTYEWTVCFSVGALTKYACIDETKTITHRSTDARFPLELNLASFTELVPEALLDAFGGMNPEGMGETSEAVEIKPGDDPCPMGAGSPCNASTDCDEGLLCGDGRCEPGPAVSPLPMIVRVRATTENGTTKTAGRVLNLRFLGAPNQNPTPGRLKVRSGSIGLSDALNGCQELGPFGAGLDEVPLEYLADETSLETYRTYQYDSCAEIDESDEALISWYTSEGKLDNALGSLEFPRNVLKPPQDSASTRLYLSVRDGRGGLSISCVDLRFEPPQPP